MYGAFAPVKITSFVSGVKANFVCFLFLVFNTGFITWYRDYVVNYNFDDYINV